MTERRAEQDRPIFYGGLFGALAPFILFLAGVASLGLLGAPDERGFWPVLLAAFALGVTLARDRSGYAESFLRGSSQPIVMKMVLAWMLAGVLGSLIGASGLVPALTALVDAAGLRGGSFVLTAFLICAAVATATGTSLGTVLVCGPLLYPAGGALGAEPAVLIGAILGGATFGDNVSPVSDTTIASASTQEAPMGEVVRSRLPYALIAASLASIAFLLLGAGAAVGSGTTSMAADEGWGPLAMLIAPALSITLMLRGRHLVEGLLAGVLGAVVIGLLGGWIAPAELMFLDEENFVARGLLLQGMERAVGISIFTFLLMGLVVPMQESGLLGRLSLAGRVNSRRGAEWAIFATVSAGVVLTTHSVVAILSSGRFARDLGDEHGIPRTRVANLLDITVCTYPFLLPFFIPTILAATTTATGEGSGMPRVSPFDVGLHNFHSWGLLLVVVLSMLWRGKRANRLPTNES
ncbi:MAG: Na+/H+ antiporter NhaC family protein [Planctomycetota bacterium]